MDLVGVSILEDRFERRQCSVSGLWFWSKDPERTTCGDTPEDEYTFIGSPIIQGFDQRGRALKDAMRERFLSYFQGTGHARVAPYPVLARWRNDIHLTIASIADFQPHVTSGLVPPPENPLTISQPCIRLTDVDAVGRSGRHLTTFEMMAHHVFNRPEEGEMIYWVDECIRQCDDLLTSEFGIDPLAITYVENPWSGGGNAGRAVEVIVGGLELATLVFMDLEEDEQGDIELKGDRYRKGALQIIDTGYGLERFCWAAAGTPTIYEAIYPEVVRHLKDSIGFEDLLEGTGLDLDRVLADISRLMGIMNIEPGSDAGAMQDHLIERLEARGTSIDTPTFERIMGPLSRIYAIADHLHAVTHMMADGLVPSNAKAGYLLRMMLRRILRMRDDLGIEMPLQALIDLHLDHGFDLEGHTQTLAGVHEIVRLEEERYAEMLRKGTRLVQSMIQDLDKKAKSIPDELLFVLNDSHGMGPEVATAIARDAGWPDLTVRPGFTAELAARHAERVRAGARAPAEESMPELDQHQETERLYVADVMAWEFDAKVLACIQRGDGHVAVLDRTCFYPEGGGQEADHGTLSTLDGAHEVHVHDVSTHGDHVLHHIDGPLPVGPVRGAIDGTRRHQLMDHHTAVHVVGGAARRLLGPHVFQAGANKSVHGARLDITHYQRLTRSDLDAIEDLANQTLREVMTTRKLELDRRDADRTYGFDLYQGGPPKGSSVRILEIGDHDIQACGGTHHDELTRIGSIRVVRSSAVQDGVERLHIVAGRAALMHARGQEERLRATGEVFGVGDEDIPRTSERFFEEWKSQRKRIEALEGEIGRLKLSGGGSASTVVDGIRYVVMEVDGDLKALQSTVQDLTRDPEQPTVAVVGSRDGGGKLLVAITEGTPASERHDAVAILRSIASHIGGGGGGRPTIAQGGGSNPEGLDAALEEARSVLGLSADR